jgi:putative ABC transport system substrate-binding protein
MTRREFISLLGGVAATWPLLANAQQTERVRRIGVLSPLPAGHPDDQVRYAAFLERLRQLGWTNENMRIEARWSAGDPASTRKHAAELGA